VLASLVVVVVVLGLIFVSVLVLAPGILLVVRSAEFCNIVDITEGGLLELDSFFNASTRGVRTEVFSSSKYNFAEISSSSPLWNKSSFN